jgi:DNA-directed RNA polymerase specialized sigma24 family protein
MIERDDITLLREFSATESEAAFAALVSRHLNLVYSVALRSTGNVHAAQEISHAVFIILARKAKSLAGDGWLKRWLRRPRRSEVEATPRRQDEERGRRGVAATSLSGWLYQTARLTAAIFLRGEIRRQQREQEAFMQSTLNESDASV